MDEVLPLKTLEEALSAKDHITIKYLPVPLTERIRKTGPKTILCHDLKGGYLEDRFIHGVKKENCFNFVHWSLVDIFVYFSHNLVTIPPYGWISAAHKNGTRILGTFITEWANGEEICEKFLADMASIEAMCDSLVWVALNCGFDGWLINIENKIKFSQVRCLIEFVSCLTERLHKVKEDALVIWYDSVIESGELLWQNCLNEKNRVFFDNCDGIFLNYNWTEQNLKTSFEEAGSRPTDVYVGIDVFGRGCPGGGGFNSNIALRAIRRYHLSAAVFAPGWVYECLDVGDFCKNMYKFWALLESQCSVGIFKSIPFSTSFCPGYGTKMYRNGKEISSEPWFNLSLQQIQPLFQNEEKKHCPRITMHTVVESFNGGGCLMLEVAFSKERFIPLQSFKLFSTHFTISESCSISYTFNRLVADIEFTVSFTVLDHRKEPYLLRLGTKMCEKKYIYAHEEMDVITELPCIKSEPEQRVRCWETREYLLSGFKYKGHVIQNIIGEIAYTGTKSPPLFLLLLGHFEITPVQPQKEPFLATTAYESSEAGEIDVRCGLTWNSCESVQCWDLFYELQGKDPKYLGTSAVPFYTCNLKLEEADITKSSHRITFHLHPQNLSMMSRVNKISYKTNSLIHLKMAEGSPFSVRLTDLDPKAIAGLTIPASGADEVEKMIIEEEDDLGEQLTEAVNLIQQTSASKDDDEYLSDDDEYLSDDEDSTGFVDTLDDGNNFHKPISRSGEETLEEEIITFNLDELPKHARTPEGAMDALLKKLVEKGVIQSYKIVGHEQVVLITPYQYLPQSQATETQTSGAKKVGSKKKRPDSKVEIYQKENQVHANHTSQ